MPLDSTTTLRSSNTADVIDYLITTSTVSMQNGENAWAKCCLMTASALAPDNFLIKYEAFKISKTEGNITEAAKQFADLFSPTSLQPVLPPQTRSKKVDPEKQKQFNILKEFFVDEMKLVLFAISAEWSEFSQNDLSRYLRPEEQLRGDNFYRDLFFKLKTADQIHCLTKFSTFYAEHHDVTVDLLLYIIEKYSADAPEILSDCAGRLIDIKQQLENEADPQHYPLINHLRKKYIFHILPALFSSAGTTGLKLDEAKMKQYFFDALKYFIEDFVIAPVPMVTSPKNEYELKLVEIVRLIGKRQPDWKLFKSSEFNPFSVESTLNTITAYVDTFTSPDYEPMDLSSAGNTADLKSDDPLNTEQLLYYSLVLFVICFSNYSTALGESILVERLHIGFDPIKSFLPSKKRKIIQQYQPQPPVLASCKKLTDYFNVLVRLSKIFRNVLKEDFNSFIKHVHLVDNRKYSQLQIDTLLLGGSYLEVASLISTLDNAVSDSLAEPLCQVKRYMQRISCNIRQSEQSNAVQNLLKLIDLITLDGPVKAHLNMPTVIIRKEPSAGGSEPHPISYCDLNAYLEVSNSSATRQLILLPLTQDNIIAYVIDCCVCVLKEIALNVPQQNDLALGHLVVLTQYSWPYYYEVFTKTIENIEKRPANSLLTKSKFTYPLFTKYILTPDILEEFMSLVGKRISFELGPNLSDPNQPLNLHSTRGVTRTYIEDITTLMQKQMAISLNQLSVDLFLEFLAVHMKPFLIESFKLNK